MQPLLRTRLIPGTATPLLTTDQRLSSLESCISPKNPHMLLGGERSCFCVFPFRVQNASLPARPRRDMGCCTTASLSVTVCCVADGRERGRSRPAIGQCLCLHRLRSGRADMARLELWFSRVQHPPTLPSLDNTCRFDSWLHATPWGMQPNVCYERDRAILCEISVDGWSPPTDFSYARSGLLMTRLAVGIWTLRILLSGYAVQAKRGTSNAARLPLEEGHALILVGGHVARQISTE